MKIFSNFVASSEKPNFKQEVGVLSKRQNQENDLFECLWHSQNI
jgi:hypothetical protein